MDIAWITPDSIKLLDNQPIAGRMFGLSDQTPRVAIVDEEAAAELFGWQKVGVVIRRADPCSSLRCRHELGGLEAVWAAPRLHQLQTQVPKGG